MSVSRKTKKTAEPHLGRPKKFKRFKKKRSYADLHPLTRPGTSNGWARLATKQKLFGCAGVVAAEKAGALRFARVSRTSVWGIVDTTGRASAIRHLAGPKLRDREGADVGDRAWPIGILQGEKDDTIAIVHGAENLLAAYSFWRDCPNLIIVCMLSTEPIAVDAMKYFSGKSVLLGDMGERKATRAFGRWSTQLLAVGAKVRKVNASVERFLDGTRARSFLDLERIRYEYGNRPR